MSAPSKSADEYYQLWFDDPDDTAAVARLHQLAKDGERHQREVRRAFRQMVANDMGWYDTLRALLPEGWTPEDDQC